MSEFIWLDEYKIGDTEIDLQHQHLFDLANAIVEAKNHGEITALVMQFYRYIREHFQAEENLMRQHDYPGYQFHISEHNAMLDKLIMISDAVYNQQWNTDMVRDFVKYWVLEHILRVDMLLGTYLKQHTAA